MIHVGNLAHGGMIAERARVIFNPAVDKVISRTNGADLLGGVIYQGYTGRSIEMHVAGVPGYWLSKTMLWICFDYPFNQLLCSKAFALIPSSNSLSIDFAKRLGFSQETTVKEVYPDGDLVVLALRREHCRWLAIKPPSVDRKSVV